MSDAPFKVYAVSEYNWQYDDQNHYTPDGDPSYPIRAYLSEKRAKDECLVRNMAAFRGRDIGDYSNEGLWSYVVDGETGVKEFILWANKTLGSKWTVENREYTVPADVSDAQIALLMEKFSLRFFEVVPIDFDPDTSAIVEPPKPEPPKPEPPKPEPPKPFESSAPAGEPQRTILMED